MGAAARRGVWRGWRDPLLWRFLLALLGLGIAAYLSYVALFRHTEVFCTGLGDCRKVQTSVYARILGVPVAVLGLGMYAALVALIGSRLRLRERSPRVFVVWTFALALAGALYSGYLTYLELFHIDAICEWCVTSATVVTVILLLSVRDVRAASRPEDAAV